MRTSWLWRRIRNEAPPVTRLTLRTQLHLKEVSADHYVINGTPADCVIFALRHLFVQPPDLVISGINHGANLGDDIMYSGTVAAAREAAHHGVPSIAISQAYDDKPIRFKEGAEFARGMVEAILRNGLSGEICLNVNIPIRKIKGMKITRQGCAEHTPHFNALDRAEDYGAVPPSPAAGTRLSSCPTTAQLWSTTFQSRRCSATRQIMRRSIVDARGGRVFFLKVISRFDHP